MKRHVIAIRLGHFHDVISNNAGYWGEYEIGYCERPTGITLVILRLLKSYVVESSEHMQRGKRKIQYIADDKRNNHAN